MVELRVTIDNKFNELLEEIVVSGIYHSKAELMRSAAIYLLMEMNLLQEHIKSIARASDNI